MLTINVHIGDRHTDTAVCRLPIDIAISVESSERTAWDHCLPARAVRKFVTQYQAHMRRPGESKLKILTRHVNMFVELQSSKILRRQSVSQEESRLIMVSEHVPEVYGP